MPGSTYAPEWFDPDTPHTYVTLDDAIEQGTIIVNAIRERGGLDGVDMFTLLV